jgi:glycosyltransferase involved in cell wall biosynthesis
MTAKVALNAPPQISVIVPARNEEASLAGCLASLVAQTGVSFEIIVVDDDSTDRTSEIANSFAGQGVRVVKAAPPPAGWTGKNNAVATGARGARGEWLLFTDADTIHLPGSLAGALDEARRRGVSMLSYSPQQIVETFWEKAVMPVIFGELAATYQPSRVSDPRSAVAAANGQYILIAREAYDAVGGHASVADHILEDVALARAVKRSGRKIFFRYGGNAVQTRMYRSFAQLREGWIKNLALLFPSTARLSILRIVEFVLIVASLCLAVIDGLRGSLPAAVIAASLGVVFYALFISRIRRAHFSWQANVLAVLGLPLFSYLLLRSWFDHNRETVHWKGRTYKSIGNASEPKARAEESNVIAPPTPVGRAS